MWCEVIWPRNEYKNVSISYIYNMNASVFINPSLRYFFSSGNILQVPTTHVLRRNKNESRNKLRVEDFSRSTWQYCVLQCWYAGWVSVFSISDVIKSDTERVSSCGNFFYLKWTQLETYLWRNNNVKYFSRVWTYFLM